MVTKNYTTKTAALKATKADIRNLETKKLKVNGKDVVLGAKHSQDTRETVTENDLWGQYIETASDGTIIVHDDWVINPNANDSSGWDTSITKVEDNKAYVGETGDTFFANVQTERIKNGERMFYNCTNLTTFTSDLSSLTKGYYMFYNCTNLTTFTSDLSSLTDVNNMFYFCSNLTSFSSDLSSLTSGNYMFNYCSNLTSFTSEMPSLTNGNYMFSNCKNLTTFTSDLSSLTLGSSMFMDCANLTSFTSDLPNLTEGGWMFNNCSNLTSFTSDLPSLTGGERMFYKCSLDAKSVMYIADSIKDIAAEKQLYIDGTIPYVTKSNGVYSATKGFMSDGKYVYTYNNPQHFTYIISAANVGKLTLGINVTNNSSTIQQQLEDFAKAASFDSWADLKQHFVDKGWTNVTFQYGGTDTSITYDLRNREQIIPCQIFAKLVEADKDSAEYCTEDASTFYNIEWGHDVTDTSSYTQFNSLEEAVEHFSIKPIEK